MIHKLLSLCFLMAFLSGCTVGPNYEAPHVPLQSEYGELIQTNQPDARELASRVGSQTNTVSAWWRVFHDDQLDRLVNEALRENYNLRIAASRVRQARYQRSIAAADLFPEIIADGGYNRARGSKNVALPFGASGAGGGSGSPASNDAGGAARPKIQSPTQPNGNSLVNSAESSGARGSSSSSPGNNSAAAAGGLLTPFGKGGLPGVTTELYQVGFDSNWELDVFGGTRRRIEAATADFQAAVENSRAITISLLAEVARDYLELRGTQQRLAVAQTNLATAVEILDLTRSRERSGLASETDVTRAAGQAALTRAAIPPLEASVRQTIHALSTLLAKEPVALNTEFLSQKPLPPIPPDVPVGLPSDLLKRRPDIRRAERQMAAATARIGAAKADLFPRFALTGSIGLDSSTTSHLFDWQSHYFLISPTVTWPVFEAGKIVSNIALQRANQEETLLSYRNVILTALQEVEDALVAYSTEQVRRAALAEAVRQNQDSLHLARQQYEHGLVNFLVVLDAQRTALSAEDALAQSNQVVCTDLVALYKALGGGWELHQ